MYFSFSYGKLLLIRDMLVAIASESPYPWTNLATQHNEINNIGYSADMDAHNPKAVLEIKIAQNPTSRAFLRPILEIVIAWIGVQTTPARLKQQSVHAIITVEILSPYTELTYRGKKLDMLRYKVPQTSMLKKIL